MEEGLSFSDIFDDDIPYEQKPPEMLRPMEEIDFPIQAKNLFAGLWENNLLTEVHLQDLYHATGESSLLEILKDDTIKLAFSGGTLADQELNRGKPFFLSTMRQKYGQYAHAIGKTTGYIKNHVIIHLDGSALTAAGFKVFPVNYWGNMYGGDYSEQEERIVSNQDEMKPLSKFVKDVHILIPKDLKHQLTIERLYEISELAKKYSFPIYFYPETAKEYFKAQRPEKAVKDVSRLLSPPVLSPEDLEWKEWKKKSDVRPNSGPIYVEALLRFYKGDYSNINNFPDKNVIRWLQSYHHDAYASLFADVHGAKPKHPKIFRELVSIMKKEGVKTFKDFITLMIKREDERWKKERDLQKEELFESEDLHFDVGNYSYEDRQAFCVFIIYPTFSMWYIRKNNQSTFFSDNRELNALIQRFNGGNAKTHQTIRSILNQISDMSNSPIPKSTYLREEQSPEIANGRIWGVQGKVYVSFWQSRDDVKPYWSKVESLIRNVGYNPKEAQYLFGGMTTEDALNSYEEITKGMNIIPTDKKEIELRKLVHTDPELKKLLLQLPPNRFQVYADKMNIPVVKLKQILGSMDEMTTG